ncbi:MULTISPECIES: amino acid racemase [unclassified Bradyrhizobium]|uniref:aspartate/glutamate racemase family protein n=1 Tax=unclassified Bradyrhizobium TaxID=2631580 RepID=UPI002811DE02|nr:MULTISPECIES: amino acid racemase [unclassified Bradyrhizobium]
MNFVSRLDMPFAGPFRQQRPLGVVGGMGSFATAKFLESLAQRRRAEKDQDHIPYVALSLPDISDRSRAISEGSDAPLQQILQRARWLEQAGCGAIAIPCNTAHFWIGEIKQGLSTVLIDVTEITAKVICGMRDAAARDLRLILLGTNATMQRSLYPQTDEKCFGEQFARCRADIQREAIEIIADVKSGNTVEARPKLKQLVHQIRSFAPDAIILGCSELSAISGGLVDDDDIIDPISILADACIAWWESESKLVTAARNGGE